MKAKTKAELEKEIRSLKRKVAKLERYKKEREDWDNESKEVERRIRWQGFTYGEHI